MWFCGTRSSKLILTFSTCFSRFFFLYIKTHLPSLFYLKSDFCLQSDRKKFSARVFFAVKISESDNDEMNVSFLVRFAVPSESSIGKIYHKWRIGEDFRHLFALTDRICGDESALNYCTPKNIFVGIIVRQKIEGRKNKLFISQKKISCKIFL